MSIIITSKSIDVIAKQRALVKEALGPDGVYIKTKETLLDLFDKGGLKNVDSAKIIANTISSLCNSITNNAMNVGLQWAAQEETLAFEEAKTKASLELVEAQAANAVEATKQTIVSKNIALAELMKNYGTPTYNTEGVLITLALDGKITKEIELIDKQESELGLSGISRRAIESNQALKIEKDTDILEVERLVAVGTQQDKVDVSGYKADVEKVTKDVAESSLHGKAIFADRNLTKLTNEGAYVSTQDTALTDSVIFNNKVKALNSLASTYGTFGAGGVVVNAAMWKSYFDIVDDLSGTSTPTGTIDPTTIQRIAQN